MNTESSPSTEMLLSDLKAVVSDAEALLSAAVGRSEAEVQALRASLTEKIADAKVKLEAAEHAALEKARAAAKAADDYVHENPWQSIMIAGGVGILIGYLLSSRRD